MGKREKKQQNSILVILFMHILKWKNQPERKSTSWVHSINHSRDRISSLKKKHKSFSDKYIEDNWDDITEKAIKKAEKEMEQPVTDTKISQHEAFEKKYIIIAIILLAIGGIALAA